MNNAAREALIQIVARSCQDVITDLPRLRALLACVSPDCTAEVRLLLTAAEEGIPLSLKDGATGGLPPDVGIAQAVARLQQATYLQDEAARWAVETWALALGVVPVVGSTTPGAAIARPAAGDNSDRAWIVPDLGLEMVYVAPGTFQMGSDDGYMPREEKPAHEVRLSRGFLMGKYAVTQAEYEALTGTDPTRLSTKGARNPAYGLSWDEANKFCAQLTQRERVAGRVPVGYGYRLPTEAEWEYAARGGTKSQGCIYSGSNTVDDVAWYGGNNDGLQPVGGKQANELGLYDMSGNAFEWCYDWYGDYSSESVTDPRGPDQGSKRVSRGGVFYGDRSSCRVASRFPSVPTCGIVHGFRVVLAAEML